MSTNSLPWTNKLMVENIPSDWTQDLLQNYMEVTMQADLERVDFFCDIFDTALLTFAEPMTGHKVSSAESKIGEEEETLQLSLMERPSCSVLVRGVGEGLTHDNLYFYFDNPEAGVGDGEVVDCQLYPQLHIAVVTFSCPQAASGVLAVRDHTPCKGLRVQVEPFHDHFHQRLLDRLSALQPTETDRAMQRPSSQSSEVERAMQQPSSQPSEVERVKQEPSFQAKQQPFPKQNARGDIDCERYAVEADGYKGKRQRNRRNKKRGQETFMSGQDRDKGGIGWDEGGRGNWRGERSRQDQDQGGTGWDESGRGNWRGERSRQDQDQGGTGWDEGGRGNWRGERSRQDQDQGGTGWDESGRGNWRGERSRQDQDQGGTGWDEGGRGNWRGERSRQDQGQGGTCWDEGGRGNWRGERSKQDQDQGGTGWNEGGRGNWRGERSRQDQDQGGTGWDEGGRGNWRGERSRQDQDQGGTGWNEGGRGNWRGQRSRGGGKQYGGRGKNAWPEDEEGNRRGETQFGNQTGRPFRGQSRGRSRSRGKRGRHGSGYVSQREESVHTSYRPAEFVGEVEMGAPPAEGWCQPTVKLDADCNPVPKPTERDIQSGIGDSSETSETTLKSAGMQPLFSNLPKPDLIPTSDETFKSQAVANLHHTAEDLARQEPDAEQLRPEEKGMERERPAADAEKLGQKKIMRLEKERQAAEAEKLGQEKIMRLEKESQVAESEQLRQEKIMRLEKERQAAEAEQSRQEKIMRLEKERQVAEAEQLRQEKIMRLEKERQAAEAEQLRQEKIMRLEKERQTAEAEQLRQEKIMRLEMERQFVEFERVKATEQLEQEKIEKERALEQASLLQSQLEQLRKEQEKFKSRKKHTLTFPPHKLGLLKDFSSRSGSCDVAIHQKEGTVDFWGIDDDLKAAENTFLMEIQSVAEDSVALSPVVEEILQTAAGSQYLDRLGQGHPDCSCLVQDSSLVCVAISMEDVRQCLQDFKGGTLCKEYKVNGMDHDQLQDMIVQLEKKLPLLRIALVNSSEGQFSVEGFRCDVDKAVQEVRDYCDRNKQWSEKFEVHGSLQTRACKLWCTAILDQVKLSIVKNKGEVEETSHPSQPGFALTYRCPKDVLQSAKRTLQTIRGLIAVHTIDLASEFKSYSERALVTNGLHKVGAELFCRQVEEKLKGEGCEMVVSITVPSRCTLPNLRYDRRNPSSRRPPGTRAERPKQVQPGTTAADLRKRTALWLQAERRLRGVTRLAEKQLHTQVNGTSVIIKSGNIASEKVDALVCVVGEDMKLSQTAVGQAILKAYPHIAQVIPSQDQCPGAGQVLQLAVPRGALMQGPSTLLLAVVAKWPLSSVSAIVQNMVQKCLTLASQQNESIAFPPLGVGKRFSLPADVVAQYMVSAASQFLQNNPSVLQKIIFVIYDTTVATTFRQAARNFLPGGGGLDNDADDDSDVFPVSASTSLGLGHQSADDDDDDSDDEEDNFALFNTIDDDNVGLGTVGVSTEQGAGLGGLKAMLCLQDPRQLAAVKAGLLRELRAALLCEEATAMETFKKLPPQDIEAIKLAATRRDVVLAVQTRVGKESLVVRGQRISVTETVALIKDKVLEHLSRREKQQQHHSSKIHPPSYWQICKDGLFKDIKQFIRDHTKNGKMYSVSDAELKEIESLIQKTWDSRYVGHGRDARNLQHSSIKVSKVQRLENPNLWEVYCRERERLIMRSELTPTKAFMPVEKVKGSSKGIAVTLNLSRGGPFNREIFPQVNEHYLFHGTKKEYVEHITNFGLDARLASDNSMLGRGVYLAESPTKADQYTDDKANRVSGHMTMILMRVLLGEPYINKATNPHKFQRAPCKSCYKDRCQCKDCSFFDSVIDDAGRNFREFVIYDHIRCYPEYFIKYRRL